jgi:Domain of unknown function (DUF4406)
VSRKFYIAGPMGGIPFWNYPLFKKVTAEYRAKGYEIFSPAEHDTKLHGKEIAPASGSIEEAAQEHGFSRRMVLGDDLAWIAKEADGIVMLPGWENSGGAMAEWMLAKTIPIEIHYWREDANG